MHYIWKCYLQNGGHCVHTIFEIILFKVFIIFLINIFPYIPIDNKPAFV